ncbi:MAG: hypothetical protein PVH68_04810 [Armatimonadota bacterium]|jgi:dienelactone hydrolase
MTFYDNALEAPAELIARGVADRQRLLRHETEDYLRRLSLDYNDRRAACWHHDYSSIESYLESVEPNRKRLQAALGDFGPATGALEAAVEPFMEDDTALAQWVTVEVYDGCFARGVIGQPKHVEGPVPLVICQHGIGSSPERTFGFDDPSQVYHTYARRLVEEGFAVLAPQHVTEGAPRARLTWICLMLGKTLWGLEICKLRRLLDIAETWHGIDTSRIGMWGISLGGAYTQWAVPLEPRIAVAISCAWFNHRVRKMVVDDPRHSCFLSAGEPHIFVPNWLTEFSDSDLVSLICPRPFMSQTGKGDGIAWWPWAVAEFEKTKAHYEHLGLGERCEMALHNGGHEIHYESGVEFLRKWLSGDG